MIYYEKGAVKCYEQDGRLTLEERSSWWVYLIIAPFFLFTLTGTVGSLIDWHPFYSIVMPLLLLVVLMIVWFAYSQHRIISIEREGHTLIFQRHWLGRLRREHQITASGYDDVQYGTGLTANGSAGGRLEYVMLINSKPECNFEVHSTTSKDEAEVIASQVANYTGLSLQKVKWDRDPSFISNLPSYCRHIKRTV